MSEFKEDLQGLGKAWLYSEQCLWRMMDVKYCNAIVFARELMIACLGNLYVFQGVLKEGLYVVLQVLVQITSNGETFHSKEQMSLSSASLFWVFPWVHSMEKWYLDMEVSSIKEYHAWSMRYNDNIVWNKYKEVAMEGQCF